MTCWHAFLCHPTIHFFHCHVAAKFCFIVPHSIYKSLFLTDSLPIWQPFFSCLPSEIRKLWFLFLLHLQNFPKWEKSATSAPPEADVDAGSNSWSLQLLPTFPRLFTFCSWVGIRHLLLSVVICPLLAIAPAWLSKSCFYYAIRGASTREMNKNHRNYPGSGKNETVQWAEEMSCKLGFSSYFFSFYVWCSFCLVFGHYRYLKSVIIAILNLSP